MSRLSDIYKSEKTKGGGIFSAIGKRALEKIDPRQMFDQSGLMAAMAPGLFKKYSATASKTTKSSPSVTMPQPSMSDAKMDVLISQNSTIATNTQINAKNSLVLPVMARDMNVMRQNIVKLVKLQGGTAATKADMFFKTSKEREAEYESKFARSTSPTPAAKTEDKKSGGILGFLATLLAPLLTLGSTIAKTLSTLLAPLLTLGSTIINALSPLLAPLAGLGKIIIDGIISALSGLGILKSLPVPTPKPGGSVPGAPGTPKPGAPKPGTPGTFGKIASVVAPFAAKAAVPVAAAAAVITAAEMYKDDKAEYLDLAKKKRDEGLSSEEETKLKKLSTPSLRAAATQVLNYDPIAGKASEAKTAGQIAAQQRRDSIARDDAFPRIDGRTPPPIQTPSSSAEGMQNYKSRRVSPTRSSEGQVVPLSPSPMKTPSSSVPSQVSTGTNGEFKSKEDFLIAMYPLAVEASKELGGIDPNALLTQWGFESAWGSKTSGKYNYFGIKADKSWTGNKKDVMTHEFIDGEKVKLPQPFRSYNSVEEAVNDYVGFLKGNKRYEKAGVFKAKTSEDFFQSLQKAGYATDPNYASKLSKATERTASQVASLSLPESTTSVPIMTAAAPTIPDTSAMLALAPSRPSSLISDSTVALADIKSSQRMQPVIVNAPTTNNVQQGSTQASVQYTAPNVVDSEFMKMLVSRSV